MPVFHINTGLSRSPRGFPEHPGRPFEQLIAPLLDLVGVHVEILRKLDQGSFAFDRGYRHFRLECRVVVPARSSRYSHLLDRGNYADVARKIHISHLFRFAGPFLAMRWPMQRLPT